MTEVSGPRLVRRLSVFSSASGFFSVAVGLSALLGWAFHIEFLKTWSAEPATVKVNTASASC
jgi:hypothetical protein